jgi:hypothetical protein
VAITTSGIRMQRVGEQLLAHIGSVRIRRVEELHAEIEGPAENVLCRSRIRGLAPAPDPGQRHRPRASLFYRWVSG